MTLPGNQGQSEGGLTTGGADKEEEEEVLVN